jgi:hypothetical protein
MLYALRDRLRRQRFALNVDGVRRSPPVLLDAALGLTVVSQLQHKDVLMYLAAVKSIARQVPVAAVRVLDDGSLTPADHRELAQHVPGVLIDNVRNHRHAELPVGGCWERLIAIAEMSRTSYVMQLDSDTLTLGSVPEVVSAVSENRAFTIGTWDRQGIEPMLDRARDAKRASSNGKRHVQLVAEASFDRISNAASLCYVRGCAGFAGFPAGEGKLDFIRRLSREIESSIGPIWREWGSEQVMSNLVVANLPKATVLPHPEYADCTKMHFPRTRFVHFIGTCRFANNRYAELINSLRL